MKRTSPKHHFYRMGFRHGFRGERWVSSYRRWDQWPDWARTAYSLGMFDGKNQRTNRRPA